MGTKNKINSWLATVLLLLLSACQVNPVSDQDDPSDIKVIAVEIIPGGYCSERGW